jgi:hypothetical protein
VAKEDLQGHERRMSMIIADEKSEKGVANKKRPNEKMTGGTNAREKSVFVCNNTFCCW